MFLIQKIRKNSRTIAIVLAFVFLGVPIISVVNSLINTYYKSSELKRVFLLIGDKEIDRNEFNELLRSSTGSNEYLKKVMSISYFIDREILLQYSQKFHIYISKKDVADEYNKKIEHARSKMSQRISEKDLVRSFYKMSPFSLRKSINDELLVKKVEERVYDLYSPSNIDVQNLVTKENITKDEAIIKLKKENKDKFFRGWLENKRSEINIKFEDESFNKYLTSKSIVSGDFYITNIEIANMILLYIKYPIILENAKGSTNEIKAFSMISNSIKRDLLFANEAINRGFYVDPSFSMKDKISELKKMVEKDEEDRIIISKKDSEKYFKNNRNKYMEKERVYADIIFFKYESSEEDYQKLLKKADDILDKAIKSNELPKKDVKSMDKKSFSRKYGRSYFKDGEVVPSLIKDREDRIIAKAEGDTIKYIELKRDISDDTKNAIKVKAEKVFKLIEDEKMDSKKAMDIYSDVNFKKEQGPINRGSDINNKVGDAIFNKKFGIEYKKDGIYIFKRTKYMPKKNPSFKDVSSRVDSDVKRSMKTNQIDKLLNKISKKYSIDYKGEYFENLYNKALSEGAYIK